MNLKGLTETKGAKGSKRKWVKIRDLKLLTTEFKIK